MPSNLLIRPARLTDAPAMARVHVDTWRTTYSGIVPAAHLARLSYDHAQAGWEQHLADPQGEVSFVAEDPSGQVVGLVSGGPLRDLLPGYDAEIYVLYVLQAFQGQGLGSRLVRRAAQELAQAGYHALILWVLKENSACRFYERLGGRFTGEKTVEIGGEMLVDVAYAWPDLAALAE